MKYIHPLLLIFFLAVFTACQPGDEEAERELPIMGHTTYEEKVVNGETITDTIYHTIDSFVFYDQDSNRVTRETVEGKVYVADFFFTTCPSICPVMAKQMLRVHEKFKGEEDFMILSHSIDPEYDTVALLNDYAERLGVEEGSNWRFLTGTETDVYELGEGEYYATTQQDSTAPGGFLHSGAFLLVDREGRIRGHYDGTVPTEVDKLMNDIELLLYKGRDTNE
ncbi:SCO family protein [Nafulsella turpanensis]|uniref:SCO family protein n=1 Tax=Nafulsella turpanensis TaxID=1265690 RepID=UPI000344C338|nr:SCO family protein [Nafulsella turpanensis]